MANKLVLPIFLGMINLRGTGLATLLPVTSPLVIVLLGEHFYTKNNMPFRNVKIC